MRSFNKLSLLDVGVGAMARYLFGLLQHLSYRSEIQITEQQRDSVGQTYSHYPYLVDKLADGRYHMPHL
jgi:hypothetical protein